MLLHDTGKGGAGDQEMAGARARALGLRAPGRGAPKRSSWWPGWSSTTW